MNNYFTNLLTQKSKTLPDYLKEQMINEGEHMSNIGVDDEEDHKIFLCILMYVPKLAAKILGRNLSQDELAKVSDVVFRNRKQFTINTIPNLIAAINKGLQELHLNKVAFNRTAYPNENSSLYIAPSYNIGKWLESMKRIYAKIAGGLASGEAFNKITEGWSQMEKMDFKNWMSFYQGNNQSKYITAQKSDENAPYFPMSVLKATLPSRESDMSEYIVAPKVDGEAEKKERIEAHRSKITGRLNSAEKLLCSNEGRMFAGFEFNQMLEALHNLKRQIQTANKRSVASTLFEDLIYKQANKASAEGFVKSAKFLYKLADGEIPTPPIEALPIPPVLPLTPTHEAPKEKPYAKFLKSLDEADVNDVSDADDELIVEAQAVPEVQLPKPTNIRPAIETKPSLEVIDPDEETTVKPENPRDATVADNAIEAALDKVNINDAIKRLEALSNIFRTREVARLLSIVDLILDKLNIASFFPELGESLKSNLDSNSYCSTRIESILSRLRGSVSSPESLKVDLEGKDKITTPEMQGVSNALQTQQDKDKVRKERRKAESDAELEPKATPAPELNQSVNVEKTPSPLPIK